MKSTRHRPTGPAHEEPSAPVEVIHVESYTVASARGSALQPRQVYNLVDAEYGVQKLVTDEAEPFTGLTQWGLYATPEGAALAKQRKAHHSPYTLIASIR